MCDSLQTRRHSCVAVVIVSEVHDPAGDVLTNAELPDIPASALHQLQLLNASPLRVVLGKKWQTQLTKFSISFPCAGNRSISPHGNS